MFLMLLMVIIFVSDAACIRIPLIHLFFIFTAFVDNNTTEATRKAANWNWSAMTRAINQKSSGLRHKSKRYLVYIS